MSFAGFNRQSMSRMSQYSRSVTIVSAFAGSDIDELSDEELIKRINDIKYQVRVMTIENLILENVIMRFDPTLMHGIQQAMEYGLRLHSTTNLSSLTKSSSKYIFESISNPSRIVPLSSPSRISTKRMESSPKLSSVGIAATAVRINVTERSELVNHEMDVIAEQLEKAKLITTKQHAYLRAQLEELSTRATDIEKAAENFKRDVIIEGWDKIAQRIPAEIWIRFMTEWVRVVDEKIGKLRLRTSTLNTQYAKLKNQIKMKEELSESLRPVDFEKLKIENDVCLQLIESKKHLLKELKKVTGEANLKLTIHKNAMFQQNNYYNKLLQTIKNKKRLKILIEKDTKVIKAQAESLASKLDEVKKVRLAYEVPDIMDYVKVKSELTELQYSVKFLENRVRIQQIALKSLNRRMTTAFVFTQPRIKRISF